MGGLLRPAWLGDIRAKASDGDYYVDGLLHCGGCGTPKEASVYSDSCGWVVRPVQCACSIEREEADRAEYESRRLAREIRGNRAACFHGKPIQAATFEADDGRDPEASGACRRLAEGFAPGRKGLMLFGGVGSGKTFLAACVANAVLDMGCRVAFENLATLSAEMSADYGSRRLDVLGRLSRCSLVVLDDLGIERQTETAAENSYQVVNTVTESGCTLVVTTNLDAGQLKSIDQRILSRIGGACDPVRVGGGDRRMA